MSNNIPDIKVPGANMGPIWVRQDPGGSHVGPMNLAIWDPTDLWRWNYLSSRKGSKCPCAFVDTSRANASCASASRVIAIVIWTYCFRFLYVICTFCYRNTYYRRWMGSLMLINVGHTKSNISTGNFVFAVRLCRYCKSYINIPVAQILQFASPISNDTPFRTECVHFYSDWCIKGFGTGELWNLWNWVIDMVLFVLLCFVVIYVIVHPFPRDCFPGIMAKVWLPQSQDIGKTDLY